VDEPHDNPPADNASPGLDIPPDEPSGDEPHHNHAPADEPHDESPPADEDELGLDIPA
jgi:hypothetical protein